MVIPRWNTINQYSQKSCCSIQLAGTYSVTLTASNAAGSDIETKTNLITVTSGSAPVANFIGTPTSIVAGQSVTFSDLSTNSPTNWAWTFNGGTPSTSNQQNPVVTYALPGTYTVTLIASNTSGEDTELKSGYVTVTQAPYCASQSTSTATDYISQVIIGSNPAYTNGAQNYSLYSTGPVLNTGSTYSIRLTPNTTSRKEYWRVWIDYNQNGLFTDAGELVFSANNIRKAVNGSITIPTGITGNTRMRISMKFGAAPLPCETFTNGEVEDFPVTFNTVAAPVSVTKNEGSLQLELFPNPTNDILNIRVKSESPRVKVRVYTALGVLLRDFELNVSQTTIDVSELPKGLYYIGIEAGTNNVLKKFIKE